MAAESPQDHSVDFEAKLSTTPAQSDTPNQQTRRALPNPDLTVAKGQSIIIQNASLPHRASGTTWDITITDSRIADIVPHLPSSVASPGDDDHKPRAPAPIRMATASSSLSPEIVAARGALLTPSLCHPHIHLDKAYLLSHPAHAQHRIQSGTFDEALSLTSRAKAAFSSADLHARGRRVIEESVAAGVTHMRAFVELDAGVGTRCLEAGIDLKRGAEAEGACTIQLCAFAQLPLFSASAGDVDGAVIRALVSDAAARAEVGVLGGTPYVEADRERMERNVEWLVDLALRTDKHVDFHLDYNLDAETSPLIWHVVDVLKRKKWAQKSDKTIVLGHCTRLALFSDAEWRRLALAITAAELPISFVGLPTSDLFMMRTSREPEVRGTLNVPRLIGEFGLNACLGINNIGNAFTPHGVCDPLMLAWMGVGVYSAGREEDAEMLFECVSSRAKKAVGFETSDGLNVGVGNPADLTLFGSEDGGKWKTRKKVSDAVYLYDMCRGRRTILNGHVVPHVEQS